MILSPFSIETALNLVAQGAGGTTFKALKQGLHLTGTKGEIADNFQRENLASTRSVGDAVLKVANKIFVAEGKTLRSDLKRVAVEKYASEIDSVDFSQNVKAANTINSWVESKTNNKIKDLIKAESLDADSRLVLVNAIYFKGPWEKKFDTKNTAADEFWVTPTNSKTVEYMNQKNDFHYGYFSEYNCSALSLKYNNSDVSFLIILPNERDGLPALERQLKDIDLQALSNKLYKQEVTVKLPKFKIESEFDLKDTLTEVRPSKMVCFVQRDVRFLLPKKKTELY